MVVCDIILGGMFRTVHCLAWNTHFATQLEGLHRIRYSSCTLLGHSAIKEFNIFLFLVPFGVAIYASARICLIVHQSKGVMPQGQTRRVCHEWHVRSRIAWRCIHRRTATPTNGSQNVFLPQIFDFNSTTGP